MSLCTDKFFYKAIARDAAITAATGGRIYNTADDSVENEEDTLVPYVIITNNGGQNMTEDKDDVGESETDLENIAVEIAAGSREELAMIATAVRTAVKRAFSQGAADLGSENGDVTGSGTAGNGGSNDGDVTGSGTAGDGGSNDGDGLEGLGGEVMDYSLSWGPVNYDPWKPCYWQTLNYQCETKAE